VEVQVEQNAGGRAGFAIVTEGKTLPVQVSMVYRKDEQSLRAASGEVPHFDELRLVTFDLPSTSARELKVWLHRLTQEGDSEGIPASVNVQCRDQTQTFTLSTAQKQVVLPLNGQPCRVEIAFDRRVQNDLLSSLKFIE
jgi:hypothetical protein